MLTEFCLLASLTLNEDEREVLRTEINEWVKLFLPKLEKESTKTEKCRLIASVERHEFGGRRSARDWRFCKFVGKTGIILDAMKIEIENFKITSFQKKILRENPRSENIFLDRNEIKEETGFWKLNDELEKQKISEGGEAVIFTEKFGNLETVVRIHIFDSFLFTMKFGADDLKWKTHLISDFEKAEDFNRDDKAFVPIHENVVQNFANIELFQIDDKDEEDCLGWITILEKFDGNVRNELKNGNLNLEERKKIAIGLKNGFEYLAKVGIRHFDRKLENFLLLGGVAKICDFGLVYELTGRIRYRQMGYCRRGSKYRDGGALFSGSPGFSTQMQLTGDFGTRKNYFYFLFCDWKTSWSLLYRPIDEKERIKIDELIENCTIQHINDESHVIDNITQIISLPNVSNTFCLDDPNLTKSCQMSSLRQKMTKFVNFDFKNLTQNVFDQKWSNLCVPISVTTLLRFAMKNDLSFEDNRNDFTFDKILTTLTMRIYPRSLAGLNLNPKKEENDFQTNDVETLLERICKKTYLRKSGWEIVRKQGWPEPAKSTCEYKKVTLNQNFVFSRPLTVTGAYFLPARTIDGVFYNEKVVFHQMTLDRIENNTFILQNTDFDHSPVLLHLCFLVVFVFVPIYLFSRFLTNKNDVVFSYGGLGLYKNQPSSVGCYSEQHQKAETLSATGWTSLPDHPKRISYHSLVALENQSLLLLGGIDWGNDGADQSGIWQLKDENWNQFGELLQADYRGSAIYSGRSIYYFGYYSKAIQRLDFNEAEDLQNVEQIGNQPSNFYWPVLFQTVPNYCI
ncbi:unnamed protein product [Oikopleura dioica]|uniref:Protein kinase domain-containing protein n=1 Tax=Oikopleura dioica TaxID=34765 RepID=E4XVT8_OIKDI|nr:unnamed protein product [Oikopleura dioica]